LTAQLTAQFVLMYAKRQLLKVNIMR